MFSGIRNMDPQTSLEELYAAWRALRSESAGAGWRTIKVQAESKCPVLAGREFPGNEEALLVGFTGIGRPSPDSLPQGHGFLVTCPELGPAGASYTWIALSRQRGGALDLFSVMAEDVLRIVAVSYTHSDHQRYSAFLERIRAWQEFMRRNASLLLTPEAEVGLVGELEVLGSLLRAGYAATPAAEAWQGPRHGLHDFVLNHGAIEVKSTTAADCFPARITSLAQLDDAIVSPLFVAAVRLDVAATGTTLPERVDSLRHLLGSDPVARTVLDSRLVEAGYVEAVREHYVRRFLSASVSVMRVTDGFPRLTAASVPKEVRKASYELELSMVKQPDVGLAAAFRELGVQT